MLKTLLKKPAFDLTGLGAAFFQAIMLAQQFYCYRFGPYCSDMVGRVQASRLGRRSRGEGSI
jgi:hypothetical protein